MPASLLYRVHVRIGGRRTTVSMDNILAEHLAKHFGVELGKTHAVIRDWVQREIDAAGPPSSGLSQWILGRALALLTDADGPDSGGGPPSRPKGRKTLPQHPTDFLREVVLARTRRSRDGKMRTVKGLTGISIEHFAKHLGLTKQAIYKPIPPGSIEARMSNTLSHGAAIALGVPPLFFLLYQAKCDLQRCEGKFPHINPMPMPDAARLACLRLAEGVFSEFEVMSASAHRAIAAEITALAAVPRPPPDPGAKRRGDRRTAIRTAPKQS